MASVLLMHTLVFHSCYSSVLTQVPGLIVTDHHFQVPLDHSGQTPGEISLFVRELVSPVNASKQQPYLLYLQGGYSKQIVADIDNIPCKFYGPYQSNPAAQCTASFTPAL